MILAALAMLVQQSDTTAYTPQQCGDCAEWNAPAPPRRLFGNTYYVGTAGLSAILITSDSGHVLLDGGLPESAPRIMANVRALGFRLEDIRFIGNSHAHSDHAGGIAALQRVSGAEVVALPRAAPVIMSGRAAEDDPQHAIALAFPPAHRVRVIREGESVMGVTAHATEGHSPGGTTWSWTACDGSECRSFVYGDSQTPVSADGYRYTGSQASRDFERGFTVLENLACDMLVTPHPTAAPQSPQPCRAYAAAGRARLARRLQSEAPGGTP